MTVKKVTAPTCRAVTSVTVTVPCPSILIGWDTCMLARYLHMIGWEDFLDAVPWSFTLIRNLLLVLTSSGVFFAVRSLLAMISSWLREKLEITWEITIRSVISGFDSRSFQGVFKDLKWQFQTFLFSRVFQVPLKINFKEYSRSSTNPVIL
jgi:hypothetical protein